MRVRVMFDSPDSSDWRESELSEAVFECHERDFEFDNDGPVLVRVWAAILYQFLQLAAWEHEAILGRMLSDFVEWNNAGKLAQSLSAESRAALAAVLAPGAVSREYGKYSLSLKQLGLSQRPRTVLQRAGIDTAGDLVQRSSEDLMGLLKFGKCSLWEVQECLRQHQMALRDDPVIA